MKLSDSDPVEIEVVRSQETRLGGWTDEGDWVFLGSVEPVERHANC